MVCHRVGVRTARVGEHDIAVGERGQFRHNLVYAGAGAVYPAQLGGGGHDIGAVGPAADNIGVRDFSQLLLKAYRGMELHLRELGLQLLDKAFA